MLLPCWLARFPSDDRSHVARCSEIGIQHAPDVLDGAEECLAWIVV